MVGIKGILILIFIVGFRDRKVVILIVRIGVGSKLLILVLYFVVVWIFVSGISSWMFFKLVCFLCCVGSEFILFNIYMIIEYFVFCVFCSRFWNVYWVLFVRLMIVILCFIIFVLVILVRCWYVFVRLEYIVSLFSLSFWFLFVVDVWIKDIKEG